MASRYVFRSRAITEKSFGGFYDSTKTGTTISLLVLLLRGPPDRMSALEGHGKADVVREVG